MITIKKLAGDILLLMYKLQREGVSLYREMISFGETDQRTFVIRNEADSGLGTNILKLSGGSAIDCYNALLYLEQKGFISYNSRKSTMDEMFHNFQVAAAGIDIIEGIERGEEERKEFNFNFNIKLAENINVESLLKVELGSLLKASLLG